MSKPGYISDELIAKYLEGKATAEECSFVKSYIEEHPEEWLWLETAAREIACQEQEKEKKSGIYQKSLLDKKDMDDDVRYAISGRGKIAFAAEDGEDCSCAIKAQQLILSDYGIFVSTSELTRVARENGWYIDRKGSPMDFVGELLNYYNIPAVQMRNANVYHLIHELSQGHKVIVGIDINDLNQSQQWQEYDDLLLGKEANHVLLVASIQTDASMPTQIVLSDPSHTDNSRTISMEQFMSAWEDSGYFMVATTQPAPVEYNPGMQFFDYNQGHIKQFADLTYNEIIKRLADDGFFRNPRQKTMKLILWLSCTVVFLVLAGFFIFYLFIPFNMKVNLHEDPAYHIPNLPLKNGKITLSYGSQKSLQFVITENQKEVIIPDLPQKYRNTEAHLIFEADGFETVDTILLLHKTVNISYRHNNQLAKIFGIVVDSQNGQCLSGVTLKVQNLTAQTDERGCFNIDIPFAQQRQVQTLYAHKDGYTLWTGTYEPSNCNPWSIVLERQ